MPNEYLSKAITFILRAAAGLIVSSGGYQLLDGRWFGDSIFQAYRTHHQLDVLGQPSLDELFDFWGSHSLPDTLRDASVLKIALSLLALLGLIAHVVFKSAAVTELKDKEAYTIAKRRYLSWFHLITLAIFVLLTFVFLAGAFGSGLVLVLIMIVLPAGLYLILYANDATQGTFSERFVYVALALILLVALLAWPQLYGQRVFDPIFATIDLPDVSAKSTGHCNLQKLSQGPTLLAQEHHSDKPNLLFHVCFDQQGTKFLDFFDYTGAFTYAGKAPLSKVILDIPPPIPTAEAAAAIAEAKRLLQ